MSRTPSGIAAVGDLAWGTHFCQFYEDRSDLAEALVPFFKSGLDQNEKCLWVTSDPLGREDARDSLRAAVPDLEVRERGGQIEIIDFQSWYLRSGNLSPDETVAQWLARADDAISEGYGGLRLTGNTFWLECEAFDEFAAYESKVNAAFSTKPIIALCSYCLGKCRPSDVLEVVRNHQFAISRRRGAWEVIEDASLKIARSDLETLNSDLDRRIRERTADLQRALVEKDELFREVLHRVRNNLQVITSLIRMKMRQTGVAESRQTFADVLGRIDAIALVHETLYASDELSRVPMPEYLGRLCDSLARLRGEGHRVKVRVDAQETPLCIDQAVALGLVTTELVTNALNHAFPDGREGRVAIRFRCINGQCELMVADDGIGMAPAKDQRRSGLRLLSSLADQLGGSLSETIDDGTTIRLVFPKT